MLFSKWSESFQINADKIINLEDKTSGLPLEKTWQVDKKLKCENIWCVLATPEKDTVFNLSDEKQFWAFVDLKYVDQFSPLLLQDINNLIYNDYLFYSSP